MKHKTEFVEEQNREEEKFHNFTGSCERTCCT